MDNLRVVFRQAALAAQKWWVRKENVGIPRRKRTHDQSHDLIGRPAQEYIPGCLLLLLVRDPSQFCRSGAQLLVISDFHRWRASFLGRHIHRCSRLVLVSLLYQSRRRQLPLVLFAVRFIVGALTVPIVVSSLFVVGRLG